jgi:hypothetical protein
VKELDNLIAGAAAETQEVKEMLLASGEDPAHLAAIEADMAQNSEPTPEQREAFARIYRGLYANTRLIPVLAAPISSFLGVLRARCGPEYDLLCRLETFCLETWEQVRRGTVDVAQVDRFCLTWLLARGCLTPERLTRLLLAVQNNSGQDCTSRPLHRCKPAPR